jgi:hypothetical protein
MSRSTNRRKPAFLSCRPRLEQLEDRCLLSANAGVAASAAVITPDASVAVGSGWQIFDWDNAPGAFDQEGAFTFSSATPTTLKVTDSFINGDRFDVFDHGILVGTTSFPANDHHYIDGKPALAFKNPLFSHGTFTLPPGSHSLTFENIEIARGYSSGAAYFELISKPAVTTSIAISIPNNQTVFDITASPAPRMPNIVANVTVKGAKVTGVQFQWTVTIGLPAEGDGRQIDNVSFSKTTTGTRVNFHGSDWDKLIRGGDVTITVSAVVNGQLLQATASGLEIIGQNPTAGQIETLINARAVPAKYPATTQYSYHQVLADIVNVESGNQQFINGLPNWSSDGKFGAGLMQITAASDAQVWSWQVNLNAGIALFNKDLAKAASFAAQTAHKLSAQLKSLAKKLHLSQVTLAPFTGDDVVREAVQLFNGGNDYQPERDASGKLHVDISGNVGTVPWVEVGNGFVTRVLGS